MDLPEPYLPGAISLLDQLDSMRQIFCTFSILISIFERLLVILRDGQILIGYLRTIDQFGKCQ